MTDEKKKRGNPSFRKQWIHQQTKTMRVPVIFEAILKDIAGRLDRGTLTPEHLKKLLDDDIERNKKAIAENLTTIATIKTEKK